MGERVDYISEEKENVTVLFNTQEDGNFEYWKVNIGERERGGS